MASENHRFRDFSVELDVGHSDSAPFTLAMRCKVCMQEGPTVEVPMEPRGEAIKAAWLDAREEASAWIKWHRADHRDHLNYDLVTTEPYEVLPGKWH